MTNDDDFRISHPAMTLLPVAFLFCIPARPVSLTAMKNFLLLLFALAILLVFGGSAYFLTDVSKGARFERLDQPVKEKDARD